MTTRRSFLVQTAAAGVAAATYPIFKGECATASNVRIKSAVRREETLLRLGGACDGFHMTWASDDKQYLAQQDGYGWHKDPQDGYNSKLWAVSGDPQHATFGDVPGYPDKSLFLDVPPYYGYGTLAVDGTFYQFLTSWSTEKNVPIHWSASKLIYSPDNGRTWHNQDGSTPVVWEPYERQSRETMVFFKEDQDSFALQSFLQMGRNYEANRDGYVYVYSPNGYVDGTMNQLMMFRVPKNSILKRSAYEFFAGLKPDGGAKWTKDIHAREIVHTFPRGWVNEANRKGEIVVESWLPSVSYNVPLGVYMMANTGIGCAADGSWFGKPSYLGFWYAKNPWGPWRQFHEETAWMPAKDPKARAYDMQIPPKWIAADGKSFWFAWADYQGKEHTMDVEDADANRLTDEYKKKHTINHEILKRMVETDHRLSPYYSFNVQRVDLVLE